MIITIQTSTPPKHTPNTIDILLIVFEKQIKPEKNP